jgi:prepilin-type N-terminal cleavage/methylation domain-containing protein
MRGDRPLHAGDRPHAGSVPCMEQGFTLLEMIMVCVLIGLMLSLSVPSMRSSLFSDPLKSTSRKVIGMVSSVRELAVREQQPYLLHISEGENRLWYEREFNVENPIDGSRSGIHELKFPDSVKIAGLTVGGDSSQVQDQSEIWISKKGYMHHTVIRLEDDDGGNVTLQFFPFLDSVEISDRVAGL